MSSDKGIIIAKYGKHEFRVYEFNASLYCEGYYEGIEDMELIATCVDLEDAVMRGNDECTEYGIRFIDKKKYDKEMKNAEKNS